MAGLVCVWLTRLTLSIALSVHLIPPATHTPSATLLHVHLEGLSLHAWACLHLCVCFLSVCLNVSLSPCLLWMCISKILMRCQLDSSQLITGCTLGVSASLTHSHMLFPVLIFRLGCFMLASHSTHSLCLDLLYLSLFPPLSLSICGSLDVDQLPALLVNLNFSS